MRVWWTVAVAILLASSVWAASKPHVVVLGKWTTAKLQADDRLIAQLGKRKSSLRKALAESSREVCPAPVWQPNPVRVTFATKEDPKLTFAVKSRSVDVASEDESEGEE
ncbi:MAG: hypothetical protein DMG97_15985 [Acidobacteria bacterium]|nr:MAG: hypothetical protein DMG97_15985 [Acidobacteriota bacterium]